MSDLVIGPDARGIYPVGSFAFPACALRLVRDDVVVVAGTKKLSALLTVSPDSLKRWPGQGEPKTRLETLERRCCGCKEWLPVECFHANRTDALVGKGYLCKPCRSLYAAERRGEVRTLRQRLKDRRAAEERSGTP